MAKDLKFIVKSVASNDFITGVVLFLLLALVGKCKIGLILFLGLIISMLNFIISAKITEKFINNPKKNKNGKILEPEKDLRFEDLKKFSTGILWNNESSDEYILVDNIQHKRNAIHSFTYKDIGTASDFLKDIDQLCKFIDKIIDRLPPIIDYLEYIPDGYVRNVDFQFE